MCHELLFGLFFLHVLDETEYSRAALTQCLFVAYILCMCVCVCVCRFVYVPGTFQNEGWALCNHAVDQVVLACSIYFCFRGWKLVTLIIMSVFNCPLDPKSHRMSYSAR